MNIAARRGQVALRWLILLLILMGLACAQAGEVLTPAEATERAQGNVFTGGETDVEGEFAVGDTATLTGRSFLVNLLNNPGGRIVAGQERGAQVTIENIAELEGEVWYQVRAGTGTGWVSADNLEPPEGAEEGEGEATTDNGEAEASDGAEEGGEAAEGGIRVGDTVFLTGIGFLVNLHDQPGGRIIATQERGARVTVLAAADSDGTVWYQISAPTGEGWVSEENITTEAP